VIARTVLAPLMLLILCTSAEGNDAAAPTGTGDLQRGARTTVQLCALCHTLKYLRYRDLTALGFNSDQIDELRGRRELDSTVASANSPEQARALFGTVPPELTLLAKAYDDEDHIYRFLTGFRKNSEGKIENIVRPGTAMPDVLAYTEKQLPERLAQTEQRARDVSNFLKWAADPRAPERQRLGWFVMGYLVLLTALLYLLKRKIWHRLDDPLG
jgi:ubiquinol-cytochrome c reductase cytochrome c1 subunit